jgi:hypothetical protein
MAEALTIVPALTNLNLKSNNIGRAGGIAMAEALKINVVLSKIDLRFNELGNTEQKLRDAVVSGRKALKLADWGGGTTFLASPVRTSQTPRRPKEGAPSVRLVRNLAVRSVLRT